MSKMHKFREGLNFCEAARFLSRLIDEDITTGELETLYMEEWISAYCTLPLNLIKIKKTSDTRITPYNACSFSIVEEEPIGECYCIHLPCEIVILRDHPTYALSDRSGTLYALKHRQTEDFIGPLSELIPEVGEMKLEIADLYNIATMANQEGPAILPSRIAKRNPWVRPNIDLFNFPPETEQPRQPYLTKTKKDDQQPASWSLTIAALLELLTTESGKNFNQTSIIAEIIDRHPDWSLSQSNLEKIFAKAKGAAKDQRK